MRVSVTDRCNLRCFYCLPEGGAKPKGHPDILRYEEILLVVEAARDLGFDSVRVTGGEPLVRKGIIEFLARLASVPGITDVSLTTNGVLLGELAKPIYEAGVHRLNVSLDSLKPAKFAAITRRRSFRAVWDGIVRATEVGFSPIKVNVVAMRGVNDDEIPDFARLTVDMPLHVRFIELMPLGEAGELSSMFMPAGEIWRKLAAVGELEPCDSGPGSLGPKGAGPARYFRLKGAAGTVGIIDALSRHFCASCNRLRLTADGKLHPCLAADVEVDVKSALRGNVVVADTREQLRRLIRTAVSLKPAGHSMNFSPTPAEKGTASPKRAWPEDDARAGREVLAANGGVATDGNAGREVKATKTCNGDAEGDAGSRGAPLGDGAAEAAVAGDAGGGQSTWVPGPGRCMWRLGG